MTSETRLLRCPACDGPMRAVDRRGVVIDLCRDCRGVYLDRGELDKLLATAPELAATEPEISEVVDSQPSHDKRPHVEEPWRDDRDKDWERKRRRRRGWLDEIFDFDF